MGCQIGLLHRAQEVCRWGILSSGGGLRGPGESIPGLPNGQHWAPRSLQQRAMSEGARSFQGAEHSPGAEPHPPAPCSHLDGTLWSVCSVLCMCTTFNALHRPEHSTSQRLSRRLRVATPHSRAGVAWRREQMQPVLWTCLLHFIALIPSMGAGRGVLS